jgi:hypothetical protein
MGKQATITAIHSVDLATNQRLEQEVTLYTRTRSTAWRWRF